MTPEQAVRTTKMMSEFAGEPVTVEQIGGTLYVFGPEVACLRVYRKYRGRGKVGYSSNLTTWFFSMPVSIGAIPSETDKQLSLKDVLNMLPEQWPEVVNAMSWPELQKVAQVMRQASRRVTQLSAFLNNAEQQRKAAQSKTANKDSRHDEQREQ